MIVIEAHNRNCWDSLCNTYELALPATIIEDELFYFGTEHKTGLTPSLWIQQKKIIRLDADLKDYDQVRQKFSDNFLRSIHRGELEALAILLSDKHKDFCFSTADAAPIKALGALHLSCRGTSLEELLEGAGKNTNKPPLPLQYTKKWFQQKASEGLRDNPFLLRKS